MPAFKLMGFFVAGMSTAGFTGELLEQADDSTETVLVQSVDLEKSRLMRAAWGLFRDRRPDLYSPLLTQDGKKLSTKV